MSGDDVHSARPALGIITGDLRWSAVGNLIGAFGTLATATGRLLAARAEDRQQLISEFVVALGDVSAAVDFAVGFLDRDQRAQLREHARDARNKMQHTHWAGRPAPPM